MKLKQGHCVATAAINEDNFHLILAAFRASGCLVTSAFTIESVKCFKFLEWHNNGLVKTNKTDYPEMLLTVEQVLGTDESPQIGREYRGPIKPMESDTVVYDFSRTPNSGSNITPVPQWNELDLLPPVGTECEIAASTEYLNIRYPEGTKVKIYANFTDDRGVKLAAFVDSIGKVGGVAIAKCFRPLKTERELAIGEMCRILNSHGYAVGDIGLEALYDAGFRKEAK